jgi:hypothetical protein
MRGLLVSILVVALCGEICDTAYSQTVSPGGGRSDGAVAPKGDSSGKKDLCIRSIDVELILPFGKREDEPFRICFFSNSELIASAELPDSFGVACRIDTTLSLQMNEKDTLKVSQIPSLTSRISSRAFRYEHYVKPGDCIERIFDIGLLVSERLPHGCWTRPRREPD